MHFTGSTLVIETASEACSVALFKGAELAARDHRELGRGHAERLIPMIKELPNNGRAERIISSLGPGSFTGVRIGIAAARALGVAWSAKVLGYSTLALIAAIARDEAGGPARPATVCINGGHGEWFVQDFDASGLPEGTAASLTPEAAAERGSHAIIAGNRAQQWVDLIKDEGTTALDILPDASRVNLLPSACLKQDLSPIYGRAPDAIPHAERVGPA